MVHYPIENISIIIVLHYSTLGIQQHSLAVQPFSSTPQYPVKNERESLLQEGLPQSLRSSTSQFSADQHCSMHNTATNNVTIFKVIFKHLLTVTYPIDNTLWQVCHFYKQLKFKTKEGDTSIALIRCSE